MFCVCVCWSVFCHITVFYRLALFLLSTEKAVLDTKQRFSRTSVELSVTQLSSVTRVKSSLKLVGLVYLFVGNLSTCVNIGYILHICVDNVLSQVALEKCILFPLLSTPTVLDLTVKKRCDRVLKNGPSKICRRLPLKKSCLPQLLLDSFLNNLSQMMLIRLMRSSSVKNKTQDCKIEIENGCFLYAFNR